MSKAIAELVISVMHPTGREVPGTAVRVTVRPDGAGYLLRVEAPANCGLKDHTRFFRRLDDALSDVHSKVDDILDTVYRVSPVARLDLIQWPTEETVTVNAPGGAA